MARSTMSTKVLVCDPSSISFPPSSDLPEITSQETKEAIDEACHNLLDLRRCVAFPTETVYGLGALALDADAAAQIFTTKGRPADNPLIVHVSSRNMLHRILPPQTTIPKVYDVLMRHFWPGALTLLFSAAGGVIPPIITANQPKVAIRMPSHSVARALIALADAPLAAPSANSSGKPSPTRAEHVRRDLDGKVGLILDGGPCSVGLESTVIDGTGQDGIVRVLRPGGVTVEDMRRVLGQEMGQDAPKILVHRRDYEDKSQEQAPTTPGMKYRHYSPRAPVILVSTGEPPNTAIARSPTELVRFIRSESNDKDIPCIGLMASEDSSFASELLTADGVKWAPYYLGRKNEPGVAAQRLFDGFITLDEQGVDAILVEELEEEHEGLAFMNRVRKAAYQTLWVTSPNPTSP